MSIDSRLTALERAAAEKPEAGWDADLSALTDAELARLKEFRRRIVAAPRTTDGAADLSVLTAADRAEIEQIRTKIVYTPREVP